MLVLFIGLVLYNRYAGNEDNNKETAMTDEDRQGTIEQLNYETYEAFSYYEKNQKLSKTAYVYLPYGYDESNQHGRGAELFPLDNEIMGWLFDRKDTDNMETY